MSPASVTGWENGAKQPNRATVAKLAWALRVEPQFFAGGIPPCVEKPHFRSLRSTPQVAQDEAEAYGQFITEIAGLLEKVVELPETLLPDLPVAPDEAGGSPEEVAREARVFFGVTPGPIQHLVRLAERAGVVVGLAWTSVGGEILFVESSLQPGQSGKLILTGSLGDVMKESATLALSYIRAHATQLGIDLETLKDQEIHIHVPEGAIPKDGPSAGITMVTSLVSAMTRRRVRAHMAMTGEITLRGKVLPVGGIKEKILAAKRSGITDIILCRENEKDILEINEHYLEGLNFHYVDEITEVLDFALLDEIVDKAK